MAIQILHVVTYMGRGGLETMLMNYYRHIDRDKVQFDFLVHRDFEADYDAEILSLGGRIYHMPRLIPWSLSYRKRLKEFFRAHPEYSIVHVHQDCLSSVALQCAKECGIPVRIAHSHNSNQDKNLKYLIKRYYMKKIPRYATHLFACGKQAGEWMFNGLPYTILANAVDTASYIYSPKVSDQVRRQLNLTEKLVVGHVGRFNPQKNHEFLIDVFHEIAKREPNAQLLLVGDGDGIQSIREKAIACGIENKITFAGVRSDVSDLMQAMDVFVFPSLYEGLPVTLIEAQAAGLRCIISDTISRECVVSLGLVTSKSLADSPAGWAAHIIEQAKYTRTDHTGEIRNHGYEITDAAKKLERFYLEQGV